MLSEIKFHNCDPLQRFPYQISHSISSCGGKFLKLPENINILLWDEKYHSRLAETSDIEICIFQLWEIQDFLMNNLFFFAKYPWLLMIFKGQ